MSLIQNKNIDNITVGDLMIPGEKVAHVQLGNPLDHALLVLVKSGYSAVPVLDARFRLIGTIGKTAILNEILGLERFEMEKLGDMQVKDVMDLDIPNLKRTDHFMEGLKAAIDYPFVCVADESGLFDGILTRRAILKHLTRDFYISQSVVTKSTANKG